MGTHSILSVQFEVEVSFSVPLFICHSFVKYTIIRKASNKKNIVDTFVKNLALQHQKFSKAEN